MLRPAAAFEAFLEENLSEVTLAHGYRYVAYFVVRASRAEVAEVDLSRMTSQRKPV